MTMDFCGECGARVVDGNCACCDPDVTDGGFTPRHDDYGAFSVVRTFEALIALERGEHFEVLASLRDCVVLGKSTAGGLHGIS